MEKERRKKNVVMICGRGAARLVTIKAKMYPVAKWNSFLAGW